jgi:hypothetical protein
LQPRQATSTVDKLGFTLYLPLPQDLDWVSRVAFGVCARQYLYALQLHEDMVRKDMKTWQVGSSGYSGKIY